jgi:hypothetical protein
VHATENPAKMAATTTIVLKSMVTNVVLMSEYKSRVEEIWELKQLKSILVF